MAKSLKGRSKSTLSEGQLRSPITLHLVLPLGPSLSNHVGCIVNNTLYIHGGITKYMSRVPLNSLYKLPLDVDSPVWNEIRTSGSPSLSHHACVVRDNRYILMIGGWTGKIRTSGVTAYDIQEDAWITLTTTGFPEGGGLSSHTAAALEDGRVLVIGREGSARIQRRYGNAWLLHGDINSGLFTYSEHSMILASRSGHTMHTVGSTLAIIGGRIDRHVELHQTYRSTTVPNPLMKVLSEMAKTTRAMAKSPCGRKQHVSVSSHGVILVHGGDTFDGKSRFPVGDFYLVSLRPQVEWRHLGGSGVCRAGHVCCLSGDDIIIHGGLGAQNATHCDTYRIKVST